MLWGNVFPAGQALSYALYGSFLDHAVGEPARDGIGAAPRVDEPERPLGRGVLPRLEARARRRVEPSRRPRLPLAAVRTARAQRRGRLVGEGVHADGGQWGLYLQAVVETVPTLYLVGRYERFDPPASHRGIDLFDVGLTWIPAYYLRLKADYRVRRPQRRPLGAGLPGVLLGALLTWRARPRRRAAPRCRWRRRPSRTSTSRSPSSCTRVARRAISTDLLGQIYLRRKRFWDDGTPIVPLNLSAGRRSARPSRTSSSGRARPVSPTTGTGSTSTGSCRRRHWRRPSRAALRRRRPERARVRPGAEVDGSVRVILRLE